MADSIGAGDDPADASPSDSANEERPERSAWRRRLILLAFSFAAAWLIVRLVGRIDWVGTWDALGHLEWWQLVVLIGLLFVRQILNALPLVFFISGLGLYRAVLNDLTSHLLSVITPPPGDIVVRISMFTSWGIEASKAIAGSVMNTLAFYILRFSAPILGFLLILPNRFDYGFGMAALLGAAVAASLSALIVLGLRSELLAERVGRIAGSSAAKLRNSIDPETWAAALVTFRLDMKGTFAAGFPKSAIGLIGMLFADATVLLLALRFVGVGASDVPAVELYAAFLCIYPLTIFPAMGLGIVDAILLAAMVDVGGLEVEAAGVAALIVWRAITLGGPVLLGAVALGLWRRSRAGMPVPEPERGERG